MRVISTRIRTRMRRACHVHRTPIFSPSGATPSGTQRACSADRYCRLDAAAAAAPHIPYPPSPRSKNPNHCIEPPTHHNIPAQLSEQPQQQQPHKLTFSGVVVAVVGVRVVVVVCVMPPSIICQTEIIIIIIISITISSSSECRCPFDVVGIMRLLRKHTKKWCALI